MLESAKTEAKSGKEWNGMEWLERIMTPCRSIPLALTNELMTEASLRNGFSPIRIERRKKHHAQRNKTHETLEPKL